MRYNMQARFHSSLNFITNNIDKSFRILDLGISNEFSENLRQAGFNITNTSGEDLDIENDIELKYGRFDAVTAFEILEHLVSPFELLRKLPSDKLIATVPLRLWFAKAYRDNTDPWDRHYHEFEDWQFDWLLEKAGWKIKTSEKWISKSDKIGFRPILRNFTPRYYAVFAER
jgi:hypothetical protein